MENVTMKGAVMLNCDETCMAHVQGLAFEAHMSKFLRLGAGKGGDASVGQQLARDAGDGRGRH